MEWWGLLICLIGGLLVFMASGMTICLAFLAINIIGIMFFGGGLNAFPQLILSIFDSTGSFVFAPVPLFILMGELMFHSRMAYKVMDVFEMWMGKIPGRLSLMAILSGTLFSSLTGSAMANVAMLGSTLVPEMQARGYSKSMSLGPILGSSGLAMMIPPSSLGVILGSLAFIPIGKLLIAGILPGLLMAFLYALYVISRCALNPSLAPVYETHHVPLGKKIVAVIRDVLPLGFIVFSVIGVIVLGIATPGESAAMGALVTFIMAGIYGGLSREVIRKSLIGTFRVTVMVMMIVAGAQAFSQLLAFTGAARGLVESVIGMDMPRVFILMGMMFGLLILGCFMGQIEQMMITIPLYMPLIEVLGYDRLWFGILILINLEIAGTSPPFGVNLFVMKGVSPEGTSMTDIYKAGIPYILCDLLAMVAIIMFPAIALWMPSVMVK